MRSDTTAEIESQAFIEAWNRSCAGQPSERTRTDVGRAETFRYLAEKRAKK